MQLLVLIPKFIQNFQYFSLELIQIILQWKAFLCVLLLTFFGVFENAKQKNCKKIVNKDSNSTKYTYIGFVFYQFICFSLNESCNLFYGYLVICSQLRNIALTFPDYFKLHLCRTGTISNVFCVKTYAKLCLLVYQVLVSISSLNSPATLPYFQWHCHTQYLAHYLAFNNTLILIIFRGLQFSTQ